jgi:hypothetical protein
MSENNLHVPDYTLAMAKVLTVYVPELYRFDPVLALIPVEHIAYTVGLLLSHDVMELIDLEALILDNK